VTDFLGKKKEICTHLEVLVPNVIGLAFLDGKRMSIFNLLTMAVEEGKTVGLTYGEEKPIVRWRKQETKGGFDDSFFILVAVGDSIYSYSLRVKYN
jgi:hypothetical protein